MNDFNNFHAANGSGGSGSHQHNKSVDAMQNGPRMQQEMNGAMPMPVSGQQRSHGGMPGEMGAYPPMAMPRSPPKNKNTQLVPCKFFLQGACQAGRTCPFSHDVEASTRPAPCKYFAKGGCKFGRKCALLHITPDGTVVNRPNQFPPMPPFGGAQPPPPGPFGQPPPPGLLSLQAQNLEQRPNGDMPQDFEAYQYGPRNGGYDTPQFDMTYTSASPKYGSPPQDSRFAHSPPGKGLSVLDAPLPNSFDSNGVSMAARNGPLAASVPSRWGLESPPSSLPRKSQLGNTALRDLHNSAFGDRGMDNVLAGSSPPSGPDEPLTFPKRPLHSDRLRPRHQMISASLGTKLPGQSFEYSDDEDGDTDREEDLLPASLRDLIPEGRSRKEPRSTTDEDTSPASFLAAQRRTISGHATPSESKIGSSPPSGTSPSRFSSMFNRHPNGESNVASPLRNSSSYFASTPSRTHANGDLSPTVSSPPRQASMSMLTKELQRTKLDAAASSTQAASVGMTRTLSNGSAGGRSSFDRAMRGREKIDEEQELFDMDEVGDANRSAPRAIVNNRSNAAGLAGLARSSPRESEPTFGAIGSNRRTSK